jgi:hypothetical protein
LPKGSFPIGQGYAGTFDTGEKSGAPGGTLELRRVAPIEPGGGKQAKQAVASWREILDHMEQSRSACLAKGVSAAEADWTIQNARVVLRCMQMKAEEITRDRAMADNVKWILDRSPGAKIVLWAHNGHVGTTSTSAYKSMGTERKISGQDPDYHLRPDRCRARTVSGHE